MKIIIHIIFFTLSTFSVNAQMKNDGKWHYPDSVKNLCVNLEQGLVSSYKSLLQKNMELVDQSVKNDKSQLFEITKAIEKKMVEDEQSWERLGCALIIYGSKK